ncbi:MAG: hypothetical protein IK004_07130 [Bacteroidales bacterium]|nr:hypothetical protein [Bacteroidales bacterium]
MKEKLLFFSIRHPLSLILLLAIIVKVLAAIFTDGWLTESNFNYYTIPSSWLENHWIVYISRLLLGAFSLLIITIAYRITKIIADKTTALEIATFGALLWGVPFVTVHPFAAVVALPFILYGTLLIIKQHNLLDNHEIEKFHRTSFIIAGFCLGLGFAVYYQSLIYYIGILAALFILKNWKGALMTLIGYVVAVGITQTVVDLVIYHKPFVAMMRFFGDFGSYFSGNSTDCLYYIFGFEFNIQLVLLFLLLALVPPMSFMLFFGFFRVFRKYILLVLPTIITLVYSIIVVDVDILLLPVPTYIIAGYVGWKEFHKTSAFWTKNKWLLWTCYAIFALLNTIFMIITFVE